MLEFFHTIEKLKTQKRTGWVHEHIDQPESIADHMYRMSMMAIILDTNPPLDISKCTMMCLVHDLAEADVGDITPLCGVSHEEKVKRESVSYLS
jgi:putative hydrolase of HD superfamily